MTNKTTTNPIEINAIDLDADGAIYCPHPKAKMQLWNSHPKVFFQVAQNGLGKCPYCGTVYQLAAGESFGHAGH